MEKSHLQISGMHCASCAGLIESQLKKVPGVAEARVNFAAEKAIVVYDSRKIGIADLVAAVEKAGYHAHTQDSKDTQSQAQRQLKEISHLWKKFLISLALSVPMLYFMLFDFLYFLPGAKTLLPYIGLISFLLSTPVQFVIGAGFYKGALSAFKMRTFNMDSLIAIGTSVAYFYSLVNLYLYYLKNNSLIG